MKFHLYYLNVSTNVKLLCNVLKISGGANAPNAPPAVARLPHDVRGGGDFCDEGR